MARIVCYCFDICEASQIRRIDNLRSLGHDVVSLSFRRTNMNAGFCPRWQNIDLGTTENHNFFKRLLRMGIGLFRAFKSRSALSESEIWIARNLDLLAIAVAMRLLTGRGDVALVYECLDIHGLMTRRGVIGACMRWIERRLLERVDLLIVSSPGFQREYFARIQKYRGPVSIIENKLWLGETKLVRPSVVREPGNPLVIGWVGSLRCRKSLGILAETAKILGDGIRMEFHGNVHLHAVPDFHEMVAGSPNITYHGPYQYPDELGRVYGACDLVWAQDLWQRGANSDWLLPNRIYEASYFGCPSIALAETETGKRVVEQKLGFTVQDATAGALAGLLGSLDKATMRRVSVGLLEMPDSAFRLELSELEIALRPFLSLHNAPHDSNPRRKLPIAKPSTQST